VAGILVGGHRAEYRHAFYFYVVFSRYISVIARCGGPKVGGILVSFQGHFGHYCVLSHTAVCSNEATQAVQQVLTGD